MFLHLGRSNLGSRDVLAGVLVLCGALAIGLKPFGTSMGLAEVWQLKFHSSLLGLGLLLLSILFSLKAKRPADDNSFYALLFLVFGQAALMFALSFFIIDLKNRNRPAG
jgi:hypothetical protein